MSQLANQIAVVTGAGRGIGRAIALKFAAEGADVVCVSRTAENSEKVAAEIRALGRKAWAYAVDVADAAAVNAAAEKILAEAGKVDILVNNAGVTRDGLLMRMSEADWDTVLDTNLKGAFLFTKAFSRAMIKQRAGPHHQHCVGHRPDRQRRASAITRRARRGLIGFTQIGGARTGVARHHGERAGAGFHRDGHDGGVERGDARGVVEKDSLEQFRPGGGHCERGVVSGQPGGALHHRAGADGGWRDGDVN